MCSNPAFNLKYTPRTQGKTVALFQIPGMADSLKRNYYTAMVHERIQRYIHSKFVGEIWLQTKEKWSEKSVCKLDTFLNTKEMTVCLIL